MNVKVTGAEELMAAMRDYRVRVKDDVGRAMTKAAREVAFALHSEFRKQPPRPREGSITAAAKARGYRINSLSRSYLTGYASATRILGGNKSGYFRIIDVNGVPQAVPIVLGKRGRIVRSSRKHFRQSGALLTNRAELSGARLRDLQSYRKFLTRADRSKSTFENRRTRHRQNISDTQIPDDAVSLNRGSLAAIRALQLREKAARGGYLAAQFLTYKKITRTINGQRQTFLTKNNLLAGEVIFETDNDGKLEFISVVGRLPGSARVAAKYGIVDRAITRAARDYVADTSKYLAERAERTFSRGGRK